MRTCSAQRVREGTARKVASDAVKALTQRLPAFYKLDGDLHPDLGK